jgi:hypothetical protein
MPANRDASRADWFFNCIAGTERVENAVKDVYGKGKEAAEKATLEAAKILHLNALKNMTEQERNKINALSTLMSYLRPRTDPTRPTLQHSPSPYPCAALATTSSPIYSKEPQPCFERRRGRTTNAPSCRCA